MRKMRLLACAARWHWEGIVEAGYRQAIEVAERLADDTSKFDELREADARIWDLNWGPVSGEAEANRAACATVMEFAGDAAAAGVSCFPEVAPALSRDLRESIPKQWHKPSFACTPSTHRSKNLR